MVHTYVRAYQLPLGPAIQGRVRLVYSKYRGESSPRDRRGDGEAERARDHPGIRGDIALGDDVESRRDYTTNRNAM